MTDDVASVAALGEPVRRDLYRYVVAQDHAVARDEAATGVGVPHHVAKFNLDRLVADGLLEVEYSRPPGRSGPGAGRPTKRYRRAEREIAVHLPDRRYDLAGRVMAEAISTATRDGVPLADALRTAARAAGRAIGADCPDPVAALAAHGYEPRPAGADVTLANCPFHSLAQSYTELVCGLNLDLIDGLLDAAGATGLQAFLDPGPDRCCVTITRAGRASGPASRPVPSA